MCNEVRDNVDCVKLLFLISEQRQTEAKFGEFAFIFVILMPKHKFTKEHGTF
jgi:hypothetical protein